MKPVGKPDALNGHVRFDERGWETGRRFSASVLAPILDSTRSPLDGIPGWSDYFLFDDSDRKQGSFLSESGV